MKIEKLVLKLQQEAIEHYEKMREVAKTFDKEEWANSYRMEKKCGETWEECYCSYCQYFRHHKSKYICPLAEKAKVCYLSCCGNLWNKMSRSKNWMTWLRNSLAVLNYIKKYGTRIRRK